MTKPRYPWRDHDWEKTDQADQGLINKYRVWVCKRCGFKSTQIDGVQPDDFELGHREWDCDVQMVRKIMEA